MTVDNSHFGALNGSVPPKESVYFWEECLTFYEDGRPAEGFTIILITSCVEFFVGGPSNLWLLCHIFSKRSKVAGFRTADFFPFHLALIQILSILTLPLVVVNHTVLKSHYVMDVLAFGTWVATFMKPLFLCLVCVERYIAVVRPIAYLRFKTPKYRWGCVGALWCIYLISIITTERTTKSVCLVFLPVLAVDTFCCLSVLKVLKKPPPRDHTGVEGKKKEAEEIKTADSTGEKGCMKKKAFITIFIIQAVLTLNYLPFIICWAIQDFVPFFVLKCQYLGLALAAADSCTYLQPLLYLHRLGRLHCSVAPK